MTLRLEWARRETWQPWLMRACDQGLMGPALVRGLREEFQTLRSFHAARPVDVAHYYQNGIVPLTKAGWHALVAECFLSQTNDPAVARAITQARDVQFDLIRDGGVHFCCDERLVLELDTYQLIHGSLSLLVVAARTDNACGTDFKSGLRRRGRPVVFACDVPLALIADETLVALLAGLDAMMDSAAALAGSPWDFRYAIASALPAAAVVDHHEPRYVPDLVYGHHISSV